MIITREAIIAEARTWLGTRWQHGTSLKGVATDCIGLIVGVARELELPEALAFQHDARFQGYGRTPNPQLLMQAVELYLEPTRGVAVPGDVLLLRFKVDPQHFAILSTPDYMIHSYAPARKVVEHRIDPLWRSRIVDHFKYRGAV